jgi:hypothetical protein
MDNRKGAGIMSRLEPVRSNQGVNPYKLGEENIADLEIKELLKRTVKNDTMKICFVYGTGQFEKSMHKGYASDGMLCPQIGLILERLCNKIGIGLELECKLDIDVASEDEIAEENLILLGSGRVNMISWRLLQIYENRLIVGFEKPDDVTITSTAKESRCCKYAIGEEGAYAGLLEAFRNPWTNNDRVIFLVAGNLSIGSIASSYALATMFSKALENPVYLQNNYNNTVPAKVLKGTPRNYPVDVSGYFYSDAYLVNIDEEKPLECLE